MTVESAGVVADWVTRAVCRHHDITMWFPGVAVGPPRRDHHDGPTSWFPGVRNSGVDVAIGHCRGCPVRVECGEHAMGRERAAPARERHGLWGGATPAQRWQIHQCRTGRCGHQPGSCKEPPWNS